MTRKAGILLSVSSLPSSYGIGDFGREAYTFVDYLKQANMKIWQILPLNPVGYGNSPYQPYSSFAGDELYISLDKLKEQQLLSEIEKFQENAQAVNFDEVRKFKQKYLKLAFNQFKKDEQLMADLTTFVETEKWVENYSIFITLKKKNDMKLWLEWDEEEKNYFEHKPDLQAFAEDILYEQFLQYIFQTQWLELKKYANENGIEIMGDIPIYVSIDSQDVWENPELFLLDDEKYPTHVAGVPPDYFAKTGQRWGNPIYDWDKLQATNFKFWINRLAENVKLFDIIRIDHFRAFDTYWKIPASCDTAIEGDWIEAPGYELFNEIYRQLPDINLVAEDLGDLRPEVLELRDSFNLKGMKIVQFTFDPNETNNDFPDREGMIIYTGTHDNQTIKGWIESQSEETIAAMCEYFQTTKENLVKSLIDYTLSSIADFAILPMQDILEYDDQARFNVPGTVGSPNWEWKLVDFDLFGTKVEYLAQKILDTKRVKNI